MVCAQEPKILYSDILICINKLGMYYGLVNIIYLNPFLKNYPELRNHIVEHELKHHKNSQSSFLICLLKDVYLDYHTYYTIFTTPLLKKQRQEIFRSKPKHSISSFIMVRLYDFLTFPINTTLESLYATYFIFLIILLLHLITFFKIIVS